METETEKTPETEYNAAEHVAAINKHRRAKAVKQTLLTVVLAAVIGAVVAAITIVAVNAASRPSLDELSVDDVCALVLKNGGVTENCTTMYRLEVVPNQPSSDFKPRGYGHDNH